VWSVREGRRQPPDESYGFFCYAWSTLINHVMTCNWQTMENHAHAKCDKDSSPRKSRTLSSTHQNIQLPWLPSAAGPSNFQYSPQMLLPSMPPSQSHPPALSTFPSPLSLPVHWFSSSDGSESTTRFRLPHWPCHPNIAIAIHINH